MKILIHTQYFPPEVGAPQNRLFELARRLKKKGIDVSVLTAMPNYPLMQIHEGYRNRFYLYEQLEGIHIHRAYIYASKNKSIISRLLNYFSFTISSFFVGFFKLGKFDYILCESPPLFLGLSSLLLKKVKRARLIFNVSDLWPESAEKLGIIKNNFLLKVSKDLEEFLYKHSDLITAQTNGIVKNISLRLPHKKIHWFPNGVDIEYYQTDIISNWRKDNGFSANDFLLLYAGIIGHAQGLEIIIKAAEHLKTYSQIKFLLLGSGPEKKKLVELKEKLSLENVHFFDVVSKNQIPFIIKDADVALVPLKRLELFKGAIPSKIFENLAMKKPILLGVEGEAKELFIDKAKGGLAFIPEDYRDFCDKILHLYSHPELLKQLGNNGYNYVNENFSRDQIVGRLWNFLQINN